MYRLEFYLCSVVYLAFDSYNQYIRGAEDLIYRDFMSQNYDMFTRDVVVEGSANIDHLVFSNAHLSKSLRKATRACSFTIFSCDRASPRISCTFYHSSAQAVSKCMETFTIVSDCSTIASTTSVVEIILE